MTALERVSSRLAPILLWLPAGVPVTHVQACPPIEIVLLVAGCPLKAKLAVAARPWADVGAPSRRFNQQPKVLGSSGTSTWPSLFVTSRGGCGGARA